MSILSTVSAQQQTDTLVIYFDIDNAIVDEKKAEQLNVIVNDTNIVSISILGYTDFLGSVEYNHKLSEKRSDNVRNYLIAKGISNDIIVLSKGKGVHPNSVEKNRQDFSDKGIQGHRMVQVIYTITENNFVQNSIIVLENIIFYSGSSDFLPESYSDLENLFEIMRKFDTMKIEIHGHICCLYREIDNHYEPRSLSRAQAVKDYLVGKGIDSVRMTCKGFGSTRRRYPLEQNAYEREMNRRVEILILEK